MQGHTRGGSRSQARRPRRVQQAAVLAGVVQAGGSHNGNDGCQDKLRRKQGGRSGADCSAAAVAVGGQLPWLRESRPGVGACRRQRMHSTRLPERPRGPRRPCRHFATSCWCGRVLAARGLCELAGSTSAAMWRCVCAVDAVRFAWRESACEFGSGARFARQARPATGRQRDACVIPPLPSNAACPLPETPQIWRVLMQHGRRGSQKNGRTVRVARVRGAAPRRAVEGEGRTRAQQRPRVRGYASVGRRRKNAQVWESWQGVGVDEPRRAS